MCSFNGFPTVRPFLNRRWFLARYYFRTSLASFHEKNIVFEKIYADTHTRQQVRNQFETVLVPGCVENRAVFESYYSIFVESLTFH